MDFVSTVDHVSKSYGESLSFASRSKHRTSLRYTFLYSGQFNTLINQFVSSFIFAIDRNLHWEEHINNLRTKVSRSINLLAILQKSLDRVLFLYIFIHEVRSSSVKASITIVHIGKFYKL